MTRMNKRAWQETTYERATDHINHRVTTGADPTFFHPYFWVVSYTRREALHRAFFGSKKQATEFAFEQGDARIDECCIADWEVLRTYKLERRD